MIDSRPNNSLTKRNLKLTFTYSDIIYKDLKQAIIQGKLPPNQKITIRGLSRLFNVSMSPVREAIQRLTAEKYLSVVKRGEIKVINLSQKDIENLFGLVRVLDIESLKKNFRFISEAKINSLKKMNQKLETFYEKKLVDEYVRESIKIHRAIWKTYDNELIIEVLSNSVDKIISLAPNYVANYTPEILNNSWRHHRGLITAIEERDIEEAVKILNEHWDIHLYSGDK